MHPSTTGSFPSTRLLFTALTLAGAMLLASCGGGTTEIPFDAGREPGSTGAATVPVSPSTTAGPSSTATPTDSSEPGEPAATTVEDQASDTVEPQPADGVTTEAAWRNVTGNLTSLESECGNLTMLSSPPGSDSIIAGVARNGLWSLDGTESEWAQLGSAPGSDAIGNRPTNLLFDPDQPGTYWESGIYADGVFRTDDGGVTFAQLGDIAHVDGVAVDLTDPARQTMVATIHERPDVWLSEDGGASWRSIAATLPTNVGGGAMPHVFDSSTFLLGTWLTDQPAIYRSTDQGQTWDSVRSGLVLEYSYPFVLPDESMLWVLHNGAGIVRSSDDGVTWEDWSFAPLITPIQELGDGRLASVSADQVMISEDDGVTWTGIGPAVPFRPASFAYVVGQQTFYISQSDCGDRVLPNAVAALSLS